MIARVCLIALLFISATPARADGQLPIQTYDNATLLKNYAFAQCIGRAYQADEVKRDAGASAGGYLEFGEVNDSDAYAKAGELANEWLDKHYPSKSGEPLQLMKCIDLFHSRELKAFVKRYTKGVGR